MKGRTAFFSWVCWVLLSCPVQAQTIELEFPAFAGKTYEWVIFQGDKSIKVIEDTLPQDGKVKLEIPEKYAPYTGMSRWLLTHTTEGGGLDMAIPGHGFKVKCLSSQPNENNIVWEGYDAINELNRLHRLQHSIIDKYEIMNKATKLYDSTHPLYALFQKEKQAQCVAFEQFHQDLKKNSNYNARFLSVINLVSGIPSKLTDNDKERIKLFNEYITNELNFDHLYTSGHWAGIIQSWVQMQVQLLRNKDGFVTDFKTLTQRLSDPHKYTAFVERATYHLTQYGKDDWIEGIAPSVLASQKILSYEGKTMQVYVKAVVGTQAPDLIFTASGKTTSLRSSDLAGTSFEQTLLVFYQSGCGRCEDLIHRLEGAYKDFKSNKIRVITISADESEYMFRSASESYPWSDKYCDFKGIKGENFLRYGVEGTPTLFLLDKSGKIQQRTADLSLLAALSPLASVPDQR